MTPPAPAVNNNNGNGGGGKSRSTYAGQASLPRLPIPTLEETLDRFLITVQALLSSPDAFSDDGAANGDNVSQEMAECQREVRKFLATEGPRLQELLLDYDEGGRESGRMGSYVEEFWTDAYLAPDSSLVMNLNPFFVLEDGPDTKTSNCQTRRAASLCFSSIKFAASLKKEAIVPDSFRGVPLCMDQFRALFGACRVPETDKDSVAVDPDATHVVVLENNQMYFFQALSPDGTVSVNEDDIRVILEAIKADASRVAPEESSRNSLGVLTTLPRGEWAVARDVIVSHSESNATAMKIVDCALFVLVIDDITPNGIHQAASNMLHGTSTLRSSGDNLIDHQAGSCCNRWYDKLQVIVCQDGRAGINFEHSAIDGHTALRFASDVYAETIVSFAQSITKTIYTDGLIPSLIPGVKVKSASTEDPDLIAPKKISFELPPSVLEKIYFAESALSDQIVASDTFVLEFKEFGKTLIVHNKMSPDSFVQLSMQLAYYRLFGKIVSQYEPVLTKTFYHGRTEAVRAATTAAAKFCKLWLNPKATNDEKLDAMRLATQHHSAGIKLAASGKGLERHLFALMKIAEKNNLPVPDFYSSKAYTKLNHTILSTSNCGNPSLRLFGFGPVVQDGFGIGYIIRDFGVQYSISSKHRQTERFAHTLKQTLIDMGELLQPLGSVKVTRRSDAFKEKTTPKDDEVVEACADARATKRASTSFGRVMRREFSVGQSELKSFGQNISPSVLHREFNVGQSELKSFGQKISPSQEHPLLRHRSSNL